MNERPVRLAVIVLALVHLTLGVLGFFFLPENNQTGANTLWIFSATGILDLIRAGTGVGGLVAVLKPAAMAVYGWFVFLAFAGLTAFGVLSSATNTAGDAVNVGWADNILHALTSLAAFGIAAAVMRRGGRARPGQPAHGERSGA
ncbi:DUF4383 domain-containing protein [Amycolatopsis sp. cmx-4-54]|uniref:DUF4383 domain-containing protein n=1 Tax=Amycolatopsis sp. cmx-4-54 TaxID=2790936 RepID=UPI00397D8E1E